MFFATLVKTESCRKKKRQIRIKHISIAELTTQVIVHNATLFSWLLVWGDTKDKTCYKLETCPCQQHDRRWRSGVPVSWASEWCWVRWLQDTDLGLHLWWVQCHGSKDALAQTPWWSCCHCCATRNLKKKTYDWTNKTICVMRGIF